MRDALIPLVLLFALILALVFGFWTGFTDAAYTTASIIATRAVKSNQAIALSAIGSLIGMTLFGSAVAKTIGTGIISTGFASGEVIIATLIGALIFDIIFSWILALPISETHVLIGGLIGAGVAAGGFEIIEIGGIVNKIIIPLVTSPFIAIIFAYITTLIIIKALKNYPASKMNKYFKRLQILSSFLFSVTDATNDAQKIMGVITMLLLYYGHVSEFTVPLWVILVSYATLALGIVFGGWRIVRTMAKKITRLRPYQGFSGDLTSSIILGSSAFLGMPVSSTHVANGTLIGAGLTRGVKSVKWGTIRSILWAWILSAPLSAIFSYSLYFLIKIFV
ncbi:MAG: inorganic phosphate transporter [Candidatus Bathyarchaeota archaeon]|nr:MAG: inorganic phosphate transporter [Candidatus Bathyarchaeota archaeon]